MFFTHLTGSTVKVFYKGEYPWQKNALKRKKQPSESIRLSPFRKKAGATNKRTPPYRQRTPHHAPATGAKRINYEKGAFAPFSPFCRYPPIFATSESISTSSLIMPISFSHSASAFQLSSFISKKPCSSDDISGRSISMLIFSTSAFSG